VSYEGARLCRRRKMQLRGPITGRLDTRYSASQQNKGEILGTTQKPVFRPWDSGGLKAKRLTAWDGKQKEIADRRIAIGTRLVAGLPFQFRDVRTDDPTIVEFDSAGARSTMTRATDIEQRASEWIIRSESGNFTQGMRADLERWLQEPRNRVTFLRIKEAWRRASRMRSARPLDGNVDPDLLKNADLSFRSGPNNNESGNSGSGWPLRVAAGAALTLILYLVSFVAWVSFSPSEWIKYTTSIGGYEHVTLPDGSGIQLNTDSEIRTRLTPQRREIELLRGEALIKVVNDVRRPFTVSAANITARAEPADSPATAFVVRVRATGAVDVSVTQGRVVLEPTERLIDAALRRNPAAESTLEEGDAAAIRPAGIHLTKVGLTELNRKLSWTAGLLSFQGETLAEVTDEFNRYNRKHLVVSDPSIAGRRIGGAFQATDPDSFVSALQKWFGIHADEEYGNSGNGVIRLTSTN
jgi:transmembrane sensor